MAFNTNTLVNGEWTTRTLDVDTVLRHYDQEDRDATKTFMEAEQAPTAGIMTQTVIRSPLVHWILPLKLWGGVQTKHVAFIGDDFVQIKELRSDGHLWDVLRKDNFGSRIRNARVVGSIKAYEAEMNVKATRIKDEDDDVSMDNGDAEVTAKFLSKSTLPPQFILLLLHTGDSVFLRLRYSDNGRMVFAWSRYRVTKPMLALQPGIHVAVDPSSRYMAIGCTEHIFAIYALHSREELNDQASRGLELRHVQSETIMNLKGHIQKIEFLYPSPDDETHVILLVLAVIKGRTRMILYEWGLGCDIRTIKHHGKTGYALEQSRQMPLLLIPLTLKSSFILVYEDFMAVCQNILEGSPTFITFNIMLEPPTELHHGIGKPLWTAWTRPPRVPEFVIDRDDVYIAREDGLIKFLEIDSKDELFVKTYNNIGEFGANCGTALACLWSDPANKSGDLKSGDLLITGGDSCPGGTYLLEAKKTPQLNQPIPNWSPAHDFATTFRGKEADSRAQGETKHVKPARSKPDRLFACVGKGVKSAITEFRYGLEAKLGLETDYGLLIQQVWVLVPQDYDEAEEDVGSIFLLSVGDQTAVLQLSSNASDLTELDAESTHFDLRFRTLAAANQGRYTIQVTEKSIVIMDGRHCHLYGLEELLCGDPEQENWFNLDSKIQTAAIFEGLVVYTTYSRGCTQARVLCLEATANDHMQVDGAPHSNTIIRLIGTISSHTSTLTIGQGEMGPFAIIAGWDDDSIILYFQQIYVEGQRTLRIPYSFGTDSILLEPIVSIVMASIPSGNIVLLCGTRNGKVVILELSQSTLDIVFSRCDQLGETSAILSKDEYSTSSDMYFVSCDSRLCALTVSMSKGPMSGLGHCAPKLSIRRIWLTDALKPDFQQPTITSIARMSPNGLSCADSHLLLVSGSQILLAELSTQPKAVPRQMPINGTPIRLIYSHTLAVLIVAAIVDGKSTLLFIDPEDGAELSQPVDQKSKLPIDFVSGLGNTNERIFHLLEWSYAKDGKTWNFIIVSTDTGRLLIISVANPDRVQEDMQRARISAVGPSTTYARAKIDYYTRHKIKTRDPVYSVAGFPDGLLYCAGDSLHFEVIDARDKKFELVAQYRLPSPARDLIYENGIIYALTAAHSLELLRLIPERGYEFIRTHGDPLSRASLHHLILDVPWADRPIHLVSDKSCSLVGLWPTHNTKADTLVPLFEAEMSYSVLRFRAAECRPVWDHFWMSKSRESGPSSLSCKIMGLEDREIPNKIPEVLGLSMTGALSHYTLLPFGLWQFLRFLINLAIRSPTLCEFTYSDTPIPWEVITQPKLMMHVDGDLLKRCLEERRLEELLRLGEDTIEAHRIIKTFCEYLEVAQGEGLGEKATAAAYVERAYEILEVSLRPVL